jgi:hypothetical protein
VDVWLDREGRPGAEQLRDDIYLYAVGEDRPPAEWIRELAHEYSHLALPEVGPFTAPERWANGYLGERLFLKWLIDNEQTAAWGTSFPGWAYLANQILPLRDRFLNAGPGAPAAGRADAAGMEHYIGFALAIEAGYGPRLLREAIRLAPTTAPSGLGAGLARALPATPGAEVPIDPRAYIPARSSVETLLRVGIRARGAAYWVFMPRGVWRIALEGNLGHGIAPELEGLPSPGVPQGGERLPLLQARIDAAGWRRLHVRSATGSAFELTRVRVTCAAVG